MSRPTERFPLSEFLAALRERGMAIGVREHILVGRLLHRFDSVDVGLLRASLVSLLAKGAGDAETVRQVFDELYVAERGSTREADVPPTPPPVPWTLWWVVAIAVLTLVAVVAYEVWPSQEPTTLETTQGPGPVPAEVEEEPAPPPRDPERPLPAPERLDWTISARVAAPMAVLGFLWLYLVRMSRVVRLRARRGWNEDLDATPGPHHYDLVLPDLKPAFRREDLDDFAGELVRSTGAPSHADELDVDETVARTIEAGLAPQLAYRRRGVARPVVVLEDVSDEMRPWRSRVRALIDGLRQRAVPLDHWQFDGDGSRLFRRRQAGASTLRQLYKIRSRAPLIVVSTGHGMLGEEGARARRLDRRGPDVAPLGVDPPVSPIRRRSGSPCESSRSRFTSWTRRGSWPPRARSSRATSR